MAASLDLNRFNAIMAEYAENYENAPKCTAQIVQFCKMKQYPFKYGELNPHFSVWTKQSTPKSPKTPFGGATVTDPGSIDWDSLWSEYETKYEGSPKKPLHLFNFAKDDKGLSIKYKAARVAFSRIAAERESIEGQTVSAPSALALETNGQSVPTPKCPVLVFPKKRTFDDVEKAKAQFLDLLQQFRSSIMHDPASALQLFHFINESTPYKARYGDVKRCYEEAVKQKWFRRMKRTKKGGKYRRSKSSSSHSSSSSDDMEVDGETDHDVDGDDEEEGVQFVLEIDEEAERQEKAKEEEKKEVAPLEVMDDETFTVLLAGYTAKYENPPRSASQIMNFAKEEGQVYRYKACRVAFQRWNNIWSPKS